MDIYLISDSTYQRALRVSRQMELSPKEWVFIPIGDDSRWDRMRGRRISDPKYLVGTFTKDEMAILIRPSQNLHAL